MAGPIVPGLPQPLGPPNGIAKPIPGQIGLWAVWSVGDAAGSTPAASGGGGGGGGGSGTVTSVDVALPTSVFSASSGAITTSGTITFTFNTQTANTIFAGPTTGSAAAPTFRAMVSADIPASVALTGTPTAPTAAAGTNTTQIATTAYTTTAISNAIAGVNPAVAVQAATTAAADTSGFTYSNGVGGVGATFTGTVNTAVVIDGFTFTTLGQRLLVKNDTQSPSGAFNGVYYVTQVQTSLLAPILTRVLDYDMPSDINNTGAIPVVNGTVNALTSWLLTSAVNTVGTDPLTYSQFSTAPANARYIIGASAPSGAPTASQKIVYHRFTKAITFPANFGAYLGHTSEAGGSTNATGSTVFNIDKAANATPTTYSNVGTITFGAGTIAPTFASSGGTSVSCAQGDCLRIIAPSSPDATFADFFCTLVGFET